MDTAPTHEIRWDPYDYALLCNPHGAFRAIREQSPLYYNAEYDFFALSRYEDCIRGLSDREIFRNGKGVMLEQIRSGVPMPRGLFNFEDPPEHTLHRGLLSRVFTPNRMARLEPQIRAYCARSLDPFAHDGQFDFVRDLGSKVPMRVIGMLLGIPEEDQDAIRQRADDRLRTEAGKPMEYDGAGLSMGFDEYIDWRIANPSDDIMSQLIHTEFEDETGTLRKLGREELGNMIGFLASAGNETTNRLIGWTAKLLAEHPGQRRDICEDRSLIPQAIEEVLRFEPPAAHIGRYVAQDFEIYGTKIPEGSVVIFLTGAANRDPREFADPDRFDIHRERRPHLTFGYGHHVCLGNALSRTEGRIVLDEVLNRFPEWQVDLDNARLASASTVRGWETLPVIAGPSL
jgi:cytochrome P450